MCTCVLGSNSSGELRRVLDFELISHLSHYLVLVTGKSFYHSESQSPFFEVRIELLRVLNVKM